MWSEVKLIAVPDPTPGDDEFLKLGLPDEAVIALLHATDRGPRWCTLDQSLEPPPADWPKRYSFPSSIVTRWFAWQAGFAFTRRRLCKRAGSRCHWRGETRVRPT
jgi:hypothetical protein